MRVISTAACVELNIHHVRTEQVTQAEPAHSEDSEEETQLFFGLG